MDLSLIITTEDGKDALFVDSKGGLTYGTNLEKVTGEEEIDAIKERLTDENANIRFM